MIRHVTSAAALSTVNLIVITPESSVSVESLLDSGLSQMNLSSRIDDHQFDQLYLPSSPANFASCFILASCYTIEGT